MLSRQKGKRIHRLVETHLLDRNKTSLTNTPWKRDKKEGKSARPSTKRENGLVLKKREGEKRERWSLLS